MEEVDFLLMTFSEHKFLIDLLFTYSIHVKILWRIVCRTGSPMKYLSSGILQKQAQHSNNHDTFWEERANRLEPYPWKSPALTPHHWLFSLSPRLVTWHLSSFWHFYYTIHVLGARALKCAWRINSWLFQNEFLPMEDSDTIWTPSKVFLEIQHSTLVQKQHVGHWSNRKSTCHEIYLDAKSCIRSQSQGCWMLLETANGSSEQSYSEWVSDTVGSSRQRSFSGIDAAWPKVMTNSKFDARQVTHKLRSLPCKARPAHPGDPLCWPQWTINLPSFSLFPSHLHLPKTRTNYFSNKAPVN